IFLVGDFTARVGDPDKTKTRNLLSEEEIKKNMAGWKKQASQLIDFESKKNPVRFERNYKWLSKLKLADLIELMSHITAQRMLERDLFERRIEKGIPVRLQEFIYPLLQGYDGVAMEIDMEIGGTDQIFNMLVGRDLLKSYLGKEKFVRANKMVPAPSGGTMSKSKGNGINLNDSSEDIYGKAMSYSDTFIPTGLELLTDVPLKEIKKIEREIEKGANPMQFKKLMAFEIVKTIKGEKEAVKAQKEFERVFQKQKRPTQAEKVDIKKLSLERLVKIGAASSKSQAKRLIEQGAVKVNEEKKNDWKKEIDLQKGDIVQVGPKKFYEIK
ncbi:MAG: tyrosine--tRNA ligase, partial [Candidatus Nealsonbacteria bacterium]|nr:tyrosine--tRNA ligase [Candidatus Nealsonbacteria bacterium]